MPHVLVKLVPRRSEEQKANLAEEITKDVVSILKCGSELVSLAFEEVEPRDWTERVYKPDIQSKWGTLYKKPGYNPLEK
jgi:4-oxalocrotonate tautomerase